MEYVKLVIPKKSEYISAIRLTTSAISNIKGFNIDEIEDLKVILSEICTFFMINVEKIKNPFEIEYKIDNNSFEVEVTDKNEGILDKNTAINSEMCILIIESLADKYHIDFENKKISFKKNLF